MATLKMTFRTVVFLSAVLCLVNSKPFRNNYEDDDSSVESFEDSSSGLSRPVRQWQGRPAPRRPQGDAILFPSSPINQSQNGQGFQEQFPPPFFGNSEEFPFQGQGNNNFPGNPTVGPAIVGRPTRRPPPACNCVPTEEYNPVCGSDNTTYSNPSRLTCAQRCMNPNVSHRYFGVCREIVAGRG
ncbi:uncharacterized protein LOC132196185 isoform X2 [Neocloeon triangulifer]|uniref:uncharacterized protein LOC132196185 isoform X2 n=1 Tax=Neocloeon triangulifer TaxID=2078957 RepID=UPI00286FA459|nr:uncharacterized protein LOC132196185 isoform X2 [Neocloeon triangulifer]